MTEPGLNHVTLGMLENTKVAVAQFNPVTNQPDKESALKELAMLQTTLFSLQHQQVFQMQLIKQLQLQLAENDEDEMLLNNDQQQQQLAHEQNDNDVAQDELIKQNKNKNSEQTSFQAKHIDNNSELNLKEIENQIINLKKETSTPSQSSSR
jgi:sal-like protein